MCGLAGCWTASHSCEAPFREIQPMCTAIAHRGPDDDGVWCDAGSGIELGFRRLAILDVSPAGHQPMASSTGRYVVVFNGEIYNFAALRASLSDNVQWRGHSDTEVMLAAIERWGVKIAIEKCAGMFAIALWDRHERALHLVRDRLGEKPLYYGVFDGTLLFGSELKALRAHSAWRGIVDRAALSLYLRHNYIPAPYCIYENVRKVVPGTIVTFRDPASDPEITQYWSARDVAEAGVRNPLTGDDADSTTQLESLLRRVIGDEMVADVPLGAFLSGGVDSSALVAIMQADSTRPVQTFTIGFDEPDHNEAPHAAAVAKHIGTNHTELYVTPQDALDVIPLLPRIYDEPFADSSQIPTYLVAKLARQHVTVSLSGEGGDELFAGYNRYFWGERLWRRMDRVPAAARAAIGKALLAVSPKGWDSAFEAAAPILPKRFRTATPGSKVHKVASFMGADSSDGLYRGLMTHWRDPGSMTGVAEPSTALTDDGRLPAFDGVVNRMRYFDMVSELPDDILVKVDRAAMAVSLESRAPFLHPHVVEFAWRIPPDQLVRNGQGKWLLRQVLYKYVPRELIERPKMGFGVPIASWLRGPLRMWADELISADRLEREGYLAPEPIRQAWDEHQAGTTDNSHLLWGVLMFQAWLETQ
jgi:asparagine synthase (glutamine-hydrolysing)